MPHVRFPTGESSCEPPVATVAAPIPLAQRTYAATPPSRPDPWSAMARPSWETETVDRRAERRVFHRARVGVVLGRRLKRKTSQEHSLALPESLRPLAQIASGISRHRGISPSQIDFHLL